MSPAKTSSMPSPGTDVAGAGKRVLQVVVTRPLADAQDLVAALDQRGHAVVVEPLLTIVNRAAAEWPPGHETAQALLITSANGLRAFAQSDPRRDIRVFAVGDASAAAARSAGFATVASAAGRVEDLADLVRAHLDPRDGPLLHPAASKLAGDLKADLEDSGFRVLRAVLYDAQPARALSPNLRQKLNSKLIDVVTFFSPRTGATFASLIGEAGLNQTCASVTALCLSAAVAQKIDALPWQSVVVAERPEQAALLARLDALAASGD